MPYALLLEITQPEGGTKVLRSVPRKTPLLWMAYCRQSMTGVSFPVDDILLSAPGLPKLMTHYPFIPLM